MTEKKLWTGFEVAMAFSIGALACEAPDWVANVAICFAFIFGLPAGIFSIRRKWNGL